MEEITPWNCGPVWHPDVLPVGSYLFSARIGQNSVSWDAVRRADIEGNNARRYLE